VLRRKWRSLIEDGTYATITELARDKGLNPGYARRFLRLTLLATGNWPSKPEFQPVAQAGNWCHSEKLHADPNAASPYYAAAAMKLFGRNR